MQLNVSGRLCSGHQSRELQCACRAMSQQLPMAASTSSRFGAKKSGSSKQVPLGATAKEGSRASIKFRRNRQSPLCLLKQRSRRQDLPACLFAVTLQRRCRFTKYAATAPACHSASSPHLTSAPAQSAGRQWHQPRAAGARVQMMPWRASACAQRGTRHERFSFSNVCVVHRARRVLSSSLW